MSYDEYHFVKNWNITQRDAQLIAKLSKIKGKATLARKLLLEPLDDETNLRQSCLLDFYYDILQFSSNRGFPWHEVAASLSFGFHFISRALQGDLACAVRVLHDTAAQYVKQNIIEVKSAKLLITHLSSTFLKSFKLYMYVFTHAQEDLSQHRVVTIQTPPEPMDLKHADTSEIWKFHKRLDEISKDDETRKLNLEQLRAEIKDKMLKNEEDIKSTMSPEGSDLINIEKAEQLISSVTEKELHILQEDVLSHLQEMNDVSEIALLRKSLPIPAGLKSTNVSETKLNQVGNKSASPTKKK